MGTSSWFSYHKVGSEPGWGVFGNSAVVYDELIVLTIVTSPISVGTGSRSPMMRRKKKNGCHGRRSPCMMYTPQTDRRSG